MIKSHLDSTVLRRLLLAGVTADIGLLCGQGMQCCLTLVDFGSEKNSGRKKSLGWKIFWVGKKFGSDKKLGWRKKIGLGKKFGSEKKFGSKKKCWLIFLHISSS